MHPILEEIYKDLMKTKKKKGKVTKEEQIKAVEKIQKNFYDLIPLEVKSAMKSFRKEHLLCKARCSALVAEITSLHDKKWQRSLDALIDCQARLASAEISLDRVGELLVSTYSKNDQELELEVKVKLQTELQTKRHHLFHLLPNVKFGFRKLPSQKLWTGLYEVHHGLRSSTSLFRNWTVAYRRGGSLTTCELAALVFAALASGLSYLSRCSWLAPYAKESAARYGLTLKTAHLPVDLHTARSYSKDDLRAVSLPGAVSCFLRAVNGYLGEATAAGILG